MALDSIIKTQPYSGLSEVRKSFTESDIVEYY